MNRWTLSLFLSLVAAIALGAQKDAKAQPHVKLSPALKMEAALWAAAKAKDIKAFENLVAEDCRMVYSSGFGTRKEEIAAIKIADIKSFEILDWHVDQPNPGTILMSCKINVKGSSEGKDFSGNLFSTSAWIKTKAGWKMRLHSEVRAK